MTTSLTKAWNSPRDLCFMFFCHGALVSNTSMVELQPPYWSGFHNLVLQGREKLLHCIQDVLYLFKAMQRCTSEKTVSMSHPLKYIWTLVLLLFSFFFFLSSFFFFLFSPHLKSTYSFFFWALVLWRNCGKFHMLLKIPEQLDSLRGGMSEGPWIFWCT